MIIFLLVQDRQDPDAEIVGAQEQNSDYIRQMPEARKSMEEVRRLEEED